MHRLLAALTLPLLLLSLAAAQKAPDSEGADLLGAVRSVRSQMTEYGDGDSQREGLATQRDLVAYDAKGNEVERTIYDDYGFLVGKQVHTRGATGDLIESVLSDPNGVVLERQVYAYADGKLTQIVHHDGKGDVGLREVSAYDEAGRVREVTYYEGKEIVGKTAYSHDGNGRVSEVAFYLADGSRAVAPIGPCLGAHRMTSAYDEMGRPVKVVAYEPDGVLKKSRLYSYNANGQMAEDIREDRWSRTTFVYAYEYDSRGNWIRQIATIRYRSKLGGSELDETARTMSDNRTMISREIAYY